MNEIIHAKIGDSKMSHTVENSDTFIPIYATGGNDILKKFYS